MKIVGVIVEYNPLHNGHLYHIQKIKELAKPDLLIGVLSSSVTMRGDISLFNKFHKTEQALELGLDLVIELPMALAMHKADIFALHAISLLHMAKVDEIWIGSEENSLTCYEKCYQALKDKQDLINEKLKTGLSYKKITNDIYPLQSNDILGYSYYKAIKENNFPIVLKTIKRMESNYLDKEPTHTTFTSALSIRKNLSLMEQYTPAFVSINKKDIFDEEKIFLYLKYKILSSSKEQLKDLFFVDEGLENKLKDIKDFNTFDLFIEYLTSKRYTSTRIKRMLMYILFNMTKQEMNQILSTPLNYIRVLGYSTQGKQYLSTLKNLVTIYTNIKEDINPTLNTEIRVSKILDTIYNCNLFNQEQKAPIYKE